MNQRLPRLWCQVCTRVGAKSEAVYSMDVEECSGMRLQFPRILLCEKHCRSMCKLIADETDLTALVRAV